MVSSQVSFCVVGHHSRMAQAATLSAVLGGQMFIDYEDRGANFNHRRAVEWANEQNHRVVIVEDDAVLMCDSLRRFGEWVYRFPDNLVSFYLGTGRPPQYQPAIAMKLVDADKTRSDYIVLDRLIHGVCYSIPVEKTDRVLDRWDSRKPADFAVGDACGGNVVYPVYSLVDHKDTDTIEKHPDGRPRRERRQAWRTWKGD